MLSQTYGDFELLITDNCSTDGTFDIAKRYEGLDSRIRVVLNERNLGQFGNRNRAAELARASLIKYHDSDDLMHRPHCLSVMVPMLLAEPTAGFGLSMGNSWAGGPCPMLLTPRMAYQREFFGEGMFSCGPRPGRCSAPTCSGGSADSSIAGAPSDHLFWLRACTQVNVLLMPADLFWYRMHPSQEFQTQTAQMQNAKMAGLVWQAIDAPECPLTADEREQAKRNRAYHLAKRTLQDARRGRWRIAAERLRLSTMTAGDWIRYLRRPSRNAFAGTPLDSDGDFVTPSWIGKS